MSNNDTDGLELFLALLKDSAKEIQKKYTHKGEWTKEEENLINACVEIGMDRKQAESLLKSRKELKEKNL